MCSKKVLITIFFITVSFSGFATKTDSLLIAISYHKESSEEAADLRNKLIQAYLEFENYDSALNYAQKNVILTENSEQEINLARAQFLLGRAFLQKYFYKQAIEWLYKAENTYQRIKDKEGIANCRLQIGLIYYLQKNYMKAIETLKEYIAISSSNNLEKFSGTAHYLLGLTFIEIDSFFSAESNLSEALKLKYKLNDLKGIFECKNGLADIYYRTQRLDSAQKLYSESYHFFESESNLQGISYAALGLGKVYLAQKDYTNAFTFLDKAYTISKKINQNHVYAQAADCLRKFYVERGDFQKAYQFLEEYNIVKDKLFNEENTRAIAELQYNLDLTKKQSEIDALSKSREVDKYLKWLLFGGVFIFITVALLIYYQYKQKQKANIELSNANGNLQNVLHDLKETQSQLIQAEKMSSLGIMTAGVAHEINNPINFVSAGLASLKQDYDDIKQYVNEVEQLHEEQDISVLKSKLQKIKNQRQIEEIMPEIEGLFSSVNNGARRVSEIVKNLRTFSRHDENEKKLVSLEEGIDSTLTILNSQLINRIEVVKDYRNSSEVLCFPGQINQVFMNLISNAADAINGEGKIFIRTYRKDAEVFIEIEDTGIGMPEEIRTRIFEPFYTTKEVGKGTGLGLSIAYSIIEKHNGKIDVESKIGKGTKFIIQIPVV